MNRSASIALLILAIAAPTAAFAFGVTPSTTRVSGAALLGGSGIGQTSVLAPLPHFDPPKYDETWGTNEAMSVLKKLGYDANSWNLVSVTLTKAANDHKAVANGSFTDSAGDILYTSMCANDYYSQTLKKVCSSAPNACGMRGTGFTTEYHGYKPNGSITNQSSSACSAVQPPDSLCATDTNGSIGNGGAGAGASDAGTTTVIQRRTCAPSYSCQDQSIIQTLTDCSTKTVSVCMAPQFCSIGSSTCLTSDARTGIGTGTIPALDGSLSAIPSIVRKGESSRLFWHVVNASACEVTSGLGVVSRLTSAGAGGVSSGPVTNSTTFHLHCVGIPGAQPPVFDDDAVVNVIPGFEEI